MGKVIFYLLVSIGLAAGLGLFYLTNSGLVSFSKPYIVQKSPELKPQNIPTAFVNVNVVPIFWRSDTAPFVSERREKGIVTQPDTEMVYSIKVKGQLDGSWSEWFDGLTITTADDGYTILSGPLPDQAALHGILARVRDLGLPLQSLTSISIADEW